MVTNSAIKDVLKIESINLCFDENGKTFHTSHYEAMTKPRPTKRPRQLIVRRGAPFEVRLLTNRRFDPTVDTMVLVVSIVSYGSEKPCFGNGTETYVLLSAATDGTATAEPDELAEDWSDD